MMYAAELKISHIKLLDVLKCFFFFSSLLLTVFILFVLHVCVWNTLNLFLDCKIAFIIYNKTTILHWFKKFDAHEVSVVDQGKHATLSFTQASYKLQL